MIILEDNTSTTLIAISFFTATYQDLKIHLKNEGHDLTRIDPEDFLSGTCPDGNYINLVVKDFSLRKQITDTIDQLKLSRFSFIHDQSSTHNSKIAFGCVVYPMVSLYNNSTLEKDVIIHSLSGVAHNSIIGTGSYISGGVSIGGVTTVGKWCFINMGVILYDNIEIHDGTTIGAGTVVRKSIQEPGTYTSQLKSKIAKIK
jgi:UDP-3-O-[3-hydroxymyristoyl] glucosamine N-acyltransferase